MAGREQHARHRQHMIDALLAQLVEAGLDHRSGEFQISVFDGPVGEHRRQLFGQNSEFGNSRFRARTVAADHHAIFGGRIMHVTALRSFQVRQARPRQSLRFPRADG